MNRVKIGFSLAAALNRDTPGAFQFADEFSHTRPAHAHVLGQAILTGKTGLIVPSVAQEHGVNDSCAERKIWVFQNEIRNLGEALRSDWIKRIQRNVLLLYDFPHRFHVV